MRLYRVNIKINDVCFCSAVVLVHYDPVNGHSELVIERVTKEDSGTYTCVAENRVGTIKSLGFVSVLGENNET